MTKHPTPSSAEPKILGSRGKRSARGRTPETPGPGSAIELFFDGGYGWLSVIVVEVDERGFTWTRRSGGNRRKSVETPSIQGWLAWGNTCWRWGDDRDRQRGWAGRKHPPLPLE